MSDEQGRADLDRNFGRRMNKKLVDSSNRHGGRPMLGFRFNASFKPPKDVATLVRLVPGSYPSFDGSRVPYFEYIEHWSERCKKTFLCPRHYAVVNDKLEGTGECVSCFERDNDAKDISFRPLMGLLLLHLEDFYLIPAEDKEGNRIVYKDDSKFHKKGDPIFNRVLCLDAEEEDPKIRKAGYEKVFGKLMHWSIGSQHMLSLTAKTADLEKECTCGGKIDVPLWVCSGCNRDVIDVEADPENWGTKKVQKFVGQPFDCKCGTNEFLIPQYVCDKCDDPDPLRLWDVDLEVRRVGEGTSSQLVIGRHFPGKLDERVKDLIPNRDILHRVFVGDGNDFQAKHLRVKNPFKSADTRSHVQEYQRDDIDTSLPEDGDIPF